MLFANNTFFYKTYYIKFLLKKGWISSFDIIQINLSSKMRLSKFPNKIQVFSVRHCTSLYIHLGLLVTEILNNNDMAKVVAKSESRSLRLLIAKCKANAVWFTCNRIWGSKELACINADNNRAMRFLMGVGK